MAACDQYAKSDHCAESARTVKRKRCGHCDELLTLPVYKRHKTLYYSSESRLWRRIESSGEESAGESMVDEEDEYGTASLISPLAGK